MLVLAALACGGGRVSSDLDGVDPPRGRDGAADVLAVQITAEPRDPQLRRALGLLELRRDRPGAALAQLEIADRLGGPRGSVLGGDARRQLGELYLQRARLRIARGAPAAAADLARAEALGARSEIVDRRDAAVVAALAMLRHSSDLVRRDGQRRLEEAARRWPGDPRLGFARPSPSLEQRGAGGAWLWRSGAKRAAHDLLDGWERDGGLRAATAEAADAWLRSRRWWRGDAGRPDGPTLITALQRGGDACVFPSDLRCARDPEVAARLTAAYSGSALSIFAGTVMAAAAPSSPIGLRSSGRAALGEPSAAARWEDGAARFAARREPAQYPELLVIAQTMRRDPARGERMADDFVARGVDLAPRAAMLSALFQALGDPGRARARMEEAASSSPGEPALERGLVTAIADAGDPDAAVVVLTRAAAASGDPGWTLLAGAADLADAGALTYALQAAKLGLPLLDPAAAVVGYLAAGAWSRELGRVDEADKLQAEAAIRREVLIEALGAVPPLAEPAAGDLVALASDPNDRIARAAVRSLRLLAQGGSSLE